ncbi:MAG: TPM domain-containing protein [Oscillospiraceae bacterium]|nr:TPM domain-containing protein [Candidatus Ruminococcus equi]
MKRIFAFVFAVLMIVSLFAVSAFCAEVDLASTSQNEKQFVVDEAGLLTNEQIAQLNKKCKEVGAKYGIDVVICTQPSLNGNTVDVASADFYNGAGYSDNGVQIFVASEDRKIDVFAKGTADKRLAVHLDTLRETATDFLSNGKDDYFSAFSAFVNKVDELFPPHVALYWIPLSLILGFLIALIPMMIAKKKLKTVDMQSGAADYVKAGSMNVTQSNDIFLYRHVDRKAKPKNDSSHSSYGGGSHSSGSY